MRKSILISISLFFAFGCIQNSLNAQQSPLYANYLFNCFAYNPAIAGTTSFAELNGSIRTQWTGLDDAPQTQFVSFQSRMKFVPFGLGGMLLNDRSGNLRKTGASGAFSYVYDISDKSRFSIGLSGGMFNIRLDDENTRIQSDVDPTVANAADGVWVPDFSMGIYLNFGRFYTGFSTPQILEGDVNFDDTADDIKNKLARHYYVFLGTKIPLSGNLEFEPSVLLKYNSPAPWQYDVGGKLMFKNQFWIGGMYRSDDAVAALLGVNITNALSMAYAFDITTSNLKSQSNGSHEINLAYRFGVLRDTDRDGVPDDEDKCPREYGTKDNAGCPPNGDRDGDGIIDADDKCPDEKGPASNQGCPFNDRDGDGIQDEEDDCPDEPGVPENNGCPKLDSDGDGVSDDVDDCPNTPGPISNKGCPYGLQDSDGDGLTDDVDKCPRTYGPPSNDGCPIVTEMQKEVVRLALLNLEFEFDKYEIKSHSKPYLDRLAEVLVNNRDWNFRIAGHADSSGSFEYNLQLSKNRAEAVMYYLVSRGVSRTQIQVEYYGEMRPIDSNETDQGRQRNRRVEMEYIFD